MKRHSVRSEMMREKGKIGCIDEKENRKMTGTITYFNIERGFGFITEDESKKSVFVHISQITGTNGDYTAIGQRVTYDTKETVKGTAAVDVRFI